MNQKNLHFSPSFLLPPPLFPFPFPSPSPHQPPSKKKKKKHHTTPASQPAIHLFLLKRKLFCHHGSGPRRASGASPPPLLFHSPSSLLSLHSPFSLPQKPPTRTGKRSNIKYIYLPTCTTYPIPSHPIPSQAIPFHSFDSLNSALQRACPITHHITSHHVPSRHVIYY